MFIRELEQEGKKIYTGSAVSMLMVNNTFICRVIIMLA